ncbi:MAG: hypothetical protein M0008_07120 [Actinomycetota bacterium]|nr:hypothetical protein [Actinomycetota bacterium]
MTELYQPGVESSVRAMLRRELVEAEAELHEASERVRLLRIAVAAVESSSPKHSGGDASPGHGGRIWHDPSSASPKEGSGGLHDAAEAMAKSLQGKLGSVEQRCFVEAGEGGHTSFRFDSSRVNGATTVSDVGSAEVGAGAEEAAGAGSEKEYLAPIGGRAGEPPLRGVVHVDRGAPGRGMSRERSGLIEPMEQGDPLAGRGLWEGMPEQVPGRGRDGDRRRHAGGQVDEWETAFELRDPACWPSERGAKATDAACDTSAGERDSDHTGDAG